MRGCGGTWHDVVVHVCREHVGRVAPLHVCPCGATQFHVEPPPPPVVVKLDTEATSS